MDDSIEPCKYTTNSSYKHEMPNVLYKNIRGKEENNGWDYPIDKKPVVTMQETVGHHIRNHRSLYKKPVVTNKGNKTAMHQRRIPIEFK